MSLHDLFTSPPPGKTFVLLLSKDKYVVGRDKNNDICLTDKSISRVHAMLYPVQDCVKLEDEKSSVGTFINGSHTDVPRVPKDEHSFLKHDDVVWFGGHGNKWRLRKVDISVITTKLDPRDSIELKSLLRVLNGNQVVSEWSNSVTHLVTPKITFTPKFLLALVNCVPVVNLQYFRDAEAIVKKTFALPDVKKYIPAVADECPEEYDFSVNEGRKEIFNGLSFIFLDENKLKLFQKIVKSAGGTVSLWDNKKASIIRVNSRVIGDSKSEVEEHQEVSTYLLSKGKRLIPDSEIGLAIATVSTDKYCNPKYHPEMGHIMALETPYVQMCDSSDLLLVEVIPETILIDDDDDDDEDAGGPVRGGGNKTALRKGVVDKTVLTNTEVPETVAHQVSVHGFPDDDDDDDFIERSQQIISIVDQHSSPAVVRKRKHSAGSDSECSQMKRANSEIDLSNSPPQPSNLSSQLIGRFNSSQFITRPTQRAPSQLSISSQRAATSAVAPTKSKRTLADLLAKDASDSEEELMNFKKKKPKQPVTDVVVPAKKPVTTLLRPVDSGEKSPSGVDAVDNPTLVEPEHRIRISQVTDWLSKTLRSSCTIKSENLDETRAWIGPLLNSVQVKEFSVDLSNMSRNRTANTTTTSVLSDVSGNVSGKRNFKHFKKQSFARNCASINAELMKTKSVLVTEKL